MTLFRNDRYGALNLTCLLGAHRLVTLRVGSVGLFIVHTVAMFTLHTHTVGSGSWLDISGGSHSLQGAILQVEEKRSYQLLDFFEFSDGGFGLFEQLLVVVVLLLFFQVLFFVIQFDFCWQLR